MKQVQAAIVKGGNKPMPPGELKGFCANIETEATGHHPGGVKGHKNCPDCEAPA